MGGIAFLTAWIKKTNFLSAHQEGRAIDIFPHMRHTALDFSKNNESQREDLKTIAKKNNISGHKTYSSGNFHMAVF